MRPYSILVNTPQAETVKLGQLWNERQQEDHRVDDKVVKSVLGVETGQQVQHNGNAHEKLASGCELSSRVDLLPVRCVAVFSLIRCFKRCSFYKMKESVHADAVQNIGKGPGSTSGQPGHA